MTPELQSDLAWLRGRGLDLTGRTIGVLTVIEYAGRAVDGSGTSLWSCHCSACGGTKVLAAQYLRTPRPSCSRECASVQRIGKPRRVGIFEWNRQKNGPH